MKNRVLKVLNNFEYKNIESMGGQRVGSVHYGQI